MDVSKQRCWHRESRPSCPGPSGQPQAPLGTSAGVAHSLTDDRGVQDIALPAWSRDAETSLYKNLQGQGATRSARGSGSQAKRLDLSRAPARWQRCRYLSGRTRANHRGGSRCRRTLMSGDLFSDAAIGFRRPRCVGRPSAFCTTRTCDRPATTNFFPETVSPRAPGLEARMASCRCWVLGFESPLSARFSDAGFAQSFADRVATCRTSRFVTLTRHATTTCAGRAELEKLRRERDELCGIRSRDGQRVHPFD